MAVRTDIVMGMPVTITLVDEPSESSLSESSLDAAFARLREIDRDYSPYKAASKVSRFNAGSLRDDQIDPEFRDIIDWGERTRIETLGYFDMRRPDGRFDPSGIVKGWAIRDVARLLEARGHRDFLIDAGGDIQPSGTGPDGAPWRIGIRHPVETHLMVSAIEPGARGVATSGNYIRGAHIYDPHRQESAEGDLVSLTVIGRDVLEADRFATAAFAMGDDGIHFIEAQQGLEGCAIDRHGMATFSSGFRAFLVS